VARFARKLIFDARFLRARTAHKNAHDWRGNETNTKDGSVNVHRCCSCARGRGLPRLRRARGDGDLLAAHGRGHRRDARIVAGPPLPIRKRLPAHKPLIQRGDSERRTHRLLPSGNFVAA
jgi:hypothetical protein